MCTASAVYYVIWPAKFEENLQLQAEWPLKLRV